jgi:hypothetical protein
METRMTREHHEYLIALRDSGIVNMWGASPYLAEYFGLGRKEANTILVEWIESFKS